MLPFLTLRRLAGLSTRLCFFIVCGIAGYSLILGLFFPVYTSLPANYKTLEKEVRSNQAGAGNPSNQKVFIAANVVSDKTVRGPWKDSLLQLIYLLHQDNVFLSIYQNDGDDAVADALRDLRQHVHCSSRITINDHVDLSTLPTMRLPDGKQGVSRFEYLAYARNRALAPLTEDSFNDTRYASDMHHTSFTKILFLNDIHFNPIDALHLLFSTNKGKRYDAACAMDFVSGTNFYDAFATRDAKGRELGYGPGLRLFPWFSHFSKSASRAAILDGSDAVPVKSCWGGMVAFDAKWFRGEDQIRFRARRKAWVGASECCLVHADIADRADDAIIVMNPHVRVAYTAGTFKWLWTVKRFEHAFKPLQWILTSLLSHGGSRFDASGIHDEGDDRDGRVGRFCDMKIMDVMKKDFAEANRRGERNFDIWIP